MADTPDRIAEIKAEVEKLLSGLANVKPPQRLSAELQVLQDLRSLAKWVSDLR
jgi:hypothetical protein